MKLLMNRLSNKSKPQPTTDRGTGSLAEPPMDTRTAGQSGELSANPDTCRENRTSRLSVPTARPWNHFTGMALCMAQANGNTYLSARNPRASASFKTRLGLRTAAEVSIATIDRNIKFDENRPAEPAFTPIRAGLSMRGYFL